MSWTYSIKRHATRWVCLNIEYIYIYYMYTPNFHPWLYQVSLFEMAKKNVGMSMYVPHFWTKPDIKTSDIRWVPQSTWLCEVFPMLLLLLTSCWDGINQICLGTSSVGPFRDCRSHAAFVPPSVLPVKYLIFNVLLYIYIIEYRYVCYIYIYILHIYIYIHIHIFILTYIYILILHIYIW